jgi:membrane protease subunit HflK
MAGRVLTGVLVLGALLWLASGAYQVGQGERAVIVVFGEIQTAVDESGRETPLTVTSGLHWTWPWPIAQVHKMPEAQTKTLALGQFLVAGDKAAAAKALVMKNPKTRNVPPDILDAVFDPTLVTGDRNVVHMGLNVRYVVTGPLRKGGLGLPPDAAAAQDRRRCRGWNWQFLLPENEETRDYLLESILYSVVIETVARMPVNDVLTRGRAALQQEIGRKAQQRLDALDFGIDLQSVEIKEVRPPKLVVEDFRKVTTAGVQADEKVKEALAEATKIATEGEGERDRILKLAEADRDRLVKSAESDARSFRKIAAEYRADPDLTVVQAWNSMIKRVSPNIRYHVVPGGDQQVIIQIQNRKQVAQ